MTNDKGILIKNIYYMLTYAFRELRLNNYERIAGEAFEDIYDLFAEILCRGIAYLLKQGLHREYVAVQESLPSLRGKLDVSGTLRERQAQRVRLACEHDELSLNSPNMYQINAYVTNEDVHHTGKVDGLLLYAMTQEDVQPDMNVVLNDGNRLMAHALNLNQDFAQIKQQLELLTEYTKHGNVTASK
jgi:hypothetical protein